MALILAVREGESVYVNDTKVTVIDIITPLKFKVEVDAMMPKILEIDAYRRVEVLPDVFMQAGNTGSLSCVKVAITAPADKIVLRERLYLRARSGNDVWRENTTGKVPVR
jgi:sRNA-binding carbon storage regulator CsrA